MRHFLILISSLLAFSCTNVVKQPSDPQPVSESSQLISREIFFGNPEKMMARLSPDGKYMSYLAPRDGVINIWVAPLAQLDKAKPLTADRKRGISRYFWSYLPDTLIYMQDADGDENWRVYMLKVNTGKITDLTPFAKVQSRIVAVSEKRPGEIVIGLNQRDPRYHDLFRVNLSNGQRTLIQKNSDFRSFEVDNQYRIRYANKFNEDGTVTYYQPTRRGKWDIVFTIPKEDVGTTDLLDFDREDTVMYWADSRGRNTTALVEINLRNLKKQVLLEDARVDLDRVIFHPKTNKPQAAVFNREREQWKYLDTEFEAEVKELANIDKGEMSIVSRTLADDLWILAFSSDVSAPRYYLWSRKEKKSQFLFDARPELANLRLANMFPVTITSRDGLPLVSYLTLPKDEVRSEGKSKRALPLILDVHGGPWSRDAWGYNPTHQLWANRGYAVLSVNFRGSTGFGKRFMNAGDRQWAAKMHDDLIDAVNWAVKEKIADPKKVAISGGSYGGYAALVGLTFTPDFFACGLSMVGPSSLLTLLNSIPAYWTSGLQNFKDRVGDPTTEEGKKFLLSRSPLQYVDRIRRPLMIVQGANDPRVKQAESDQIVKAMKQRGLEVLYLLYSDEGHGLVRPQNRFSYVAMAEKFMQKCLGGQAEPVGKAFDGSSIQILEGTDAFPH